MTALNWKPCSFFKGEVYRIVYSVDGNYVIRKNPINGQQRRMVVERFVWVEANQQLIPRNHKVIKIDPELPLVPDNLKLERVKKEERHKLALKQKEHRYKKWLAEYQPRTELVAQLKAC